MAMPIAAVEELAKPAPRRRPQRVLPGFGLTLGYTMLYLSLLVLIPCRRCSFAVSDRVGDISGTS